MPVNMKMNKLKQNFHFWLIYPFKSMPKLLVTGKCQHILFL